MTTPHLLVILGVVPFVVIVLEEFLQSPRLFFPFSLLHAVLLLLSVQFLLFLVLPCFPVLESLLEAQRISLHLHCNIK